MPWSFDEDVAHCAKPGVDAIVLEAKLDDDRFAERMQSIIAAKRRCRDGMVNAWKNASRPRDAGTD